MRTIFFYICLKKHHHITSHDKCVIWCDIKDVIICSLFQVLSRDSVTVTVDAVIYYRVSNPTMVMI